jgi:hypothetical protein
MYGRKRITKDMLEAAARKKWNSAQTARHYGTHRTIIDDACERFEVVLPEQPGTPTATPRKKPSALWSASPEAVQRALEKLRRDKPGETNRSV